MAAAFAGGLPGIKVTRNISTQLRSASAGGGGFRFGGLWTALIVTQIALTVTFPVFALAVRSDAKQELANDLPIAAEDFLAGRLAMNAPDAAGDAADSALAQFHDDYRTSVVRLTQRIASDPRVAGVTFAQRLPRMYHPWNQIEVEGGAAPTRDERGHRMGLSHIAPNYFDVLDVELLAGREFHSGDVEANAAVVIVNESFVSDVLAGANALGRRIRYLADEGYRDPTQEAGPWLEIVGVAPDLGTVSGYGAAGIYHPAAPGSAQTPHMIIEIAGDAGAFRPALFDAALAVDPRLRVDDVMTLTDVTAGSRDFYAFWPHRRRPAAVARRHLRRHGVYRRAAHA
jgi:hypothetical protein